MKSLLLLLLACLATQARAQTTLRVTSDESVIHYDGEALFHDWRGSSHDLGGRIVVQWDSLPTVRSVRLSVPVGTFDSGNGMRDRKMREVTNASEYPDATFTADRVALLVWRPDGSGGTWRLSGTLTFAGTSQPLTSDAAVTWDGETLAATGTFVVNLDDFKVDRPRLLGQEIDETIRLTYRIIAR